MLILLYRSDTRLPEVIFPNGFSTRKPPQEVITPAGSFESDRDYSIALSANFAAVPFFPVESSETQSWIYVVAVDDSQGPKHYLDLHSRSLSTDAGRGLPERLPYQEFPKEKNVIHIPAQNVLCAFKVKRNLEFTYCSIEKKATPDCDSFVIESKAIYNSKAEVTLKNNPHLKRTLDKIITEYNSKVGQEIDIPQPKLKHGAKELEKILARNAFFVRNRLEVLTEYKNCDYPFATNQPESTRAFFKTAEMQNSSGLFFSSEDQICKQNSLFYKAVERGFFDHVIEEEIRRKVEAANKAVKVYFNESDCEDEVPAEPPHNSEEPPQNSPELNRKYSEY